MAYETVHSVKKALSILELICEKAMENQPVLLREAAAHAGIPPATARALLRTLEECGYVRRTGHGRYEEGVRSLRVLASGAALRHLPELARPLMEEGYREFGESFVLAALHNGRRVELLRIGSPSEASPEMRFQANAECYRMRTCRVILAWYSELQVDFFVEHNGLPGVDDWPECGGTRDGLAAELLRIRRSGGCCDLAGGLTATAVPVLNEAEEVIASLGCYSPVSRTDRARQFGIFNILQGYAAQIRGGLLRNHGFFRAEI